MRFGRKGDRRYWDRLSAHRGASSGNGNHRGSIFRLIVGDALLRRGGKSIPSWGVGQSLGAAVERLNLSADALREQESPHEHEVSEYIGALPFLWVQTDPSACELRAYLERNAISLLSNFARDTIDSPSPAWLGAHSGRDLVRGSGLWNNDFVNEAHDPGFLDILENAARATPPLTDRKRSGPAILEAASRTLAASVIRAPCPFCTRLSSGQVLVDGSLAAALADGFPVSTGHTLVVPRRHVVSYFELTSDEQHAIWRVVLEVRARLDRENQPAGYNLGINVGEAAGQTVGHAHVHVIPRYAGDVEDPRGGVRWVLPSKAAYWEEPR